MAPGRIVYVTNRRNGVDFDVILHESATGTETVIYDRGGSIVRVAVAPNGRDAAITRPPRTGGPGASASTAPWRTTAISWRPPRR